MSKRAPTPQLPAPTGNEYWRSLDERADTPEFRAELEREFPPGASELDGASRREFIQLAGASLALAGVTSLAGCSDPPYGVAPYNIRPVDVTPGRPLHYASALTASGYANGVLVTAYEGRPTKVEGNPDHPISRGGTSAQEQAAILGLYDPQRAKTLKHGGQATTWSGFLRWLTEHLESTLRPNGGARLAFLLEPNGSPLVAALHKRIQAALPKARFYGHSAAGQDQVYEGTRIAFGRALEPQYDLTKARVVVSLDCDFAQEPAMRLHVARQFADRRAPGPNMNRLYAAEATMSLAGALADHRLRTRASEIPALARALYAALTGGAPADLGSAKANNWLKAVAKDLQNAGGETVVLVGSRQPAAVHALANAINTQLKSAAVEFTQPVLAQYEPLTALASEIAAGHVDTLVIGAWNPAYATPTEVGFAQLIAKVPNSIYLAPYEDETAQATSWIIPRAHELESWGDGRAVDGTVTLQQPLINPLFNGISEAELLSAFVGQGGLGGQRLLRDSYARIDELTWQHKVQKGLLEGTAFDRETPKLAAEAVSAAAAKLPAAASGVEINFIVDGKVGDGRFANNVWLQELPEPTSKLTWDNALYISGATAAKLGLESQDVVEVALRDRKITTTLWIQPGHADDSVSLALGYGRTGAEKNALDVGANANELRTLATPFVDGAVTITRAHKRNKLAITQEHHLMEGRPLALEVKNSAVMGRRLPIVDEEKGEVESGYPSHEYTGFKWAMGIDLNRCTGCSACVTACQAENNTPVVGRDQVTKRREMHWIRIDRYFSGDDAEPGMVTQPVMCVQCEKAPCEYVCPVNATVHTDEGLNDMVYNRCVGTRYCSNNCPYKVRRFNFLDYHPEVQSVARMGMNPDVTVRSRGVMEKCTYCVQRIEHARIDARVEGRPIADQEFTTACAQACPSRAIVFGSLHDQSSLVSKAHSDPRSYALLHELGTRPRTAYQARVKNPNPELSNG
jgi:molybdopterin-containing oxidoreductase family iron-sulfur binding subunit